MKGIPFSPEMALALRECRKSETRRVINTQPSADATEVFYWSDQEARLRLGDGWKYSPVGVYERSPRGLLFLQRSKYNVGDVCFVQEAWRIIMRPQRARIADEHGGHDGCSTLVQYKYGDLPSSADSPVRIVGSDRAWRECPQSADMGFADASPTAGKLGKWRSPRFMPAWAARTFVQVTSVRVERVGGITEEAALREGIRDPYGTMTPDPGAMDQPDRLRDMFAELWNRLHPKAPYRFEDSPWVWVYGLKEVPRP